LLGDNRRWGGHVTADHGPVRRSNCSSKQFTKYIPNFYFRKIRREPDLPKCNYCVSWGVSVVGKDTEVAADQLERCREKSWTD
jgi:hypothetical protein